MTGNQMKRGMAALLCMAMMSSCVPWGALAEGEATPSEAGAAQNEGLVQSIQIDPADLQNLGKDTAQNTPDPGVQALPLSGDITGESGGGTGTDSTPQFTSAEASANDASASDAQDGSISGSAVFSGSTVVVKLSSGDSVVGEKTLSESGSFQFDGLAAGDYYLRFYFWGEGQTPLQEIAVTVGYKEAEDDPTPPPPEEEEYKNFEMSCSVNNGVITVSVTGASDKEITISVSGNGVSEFNGIIPSGGAGSGELGKLNEEEECFEALDAGTYTVNAQYTSYADYVKTQSVTVSGSGGSDSEVTPTPAPETSVSATPDTTAPTPEAPTPVPDTPLGEAEVSAFTAQAFVSDSVLSVLIEGASEREIEVVLLDAAGNEVSRMSRIGSGQVKLGTFVTGTYSARVQYVTPVVGADGTYDYKTVTLTGIQVESSATQNPEPVTPIDIQAQVETGKDYIIVTVTQSNDADMYVALDDMTPKLVSKGGSARFDGLTAGESYDLEIDYVEPIQGASPYRTSVTIPEPVVLGPITIASVTPGTNMLTVSGTATAGQQIILTTTPAAAADAYAVAGDNGTFSVQISCAAGTYTAVTAKYVADGTVSHTASGSWVVTPPAQKPTLTVDAVTALSTTVVGKTTAGTVVEIKTSDYSQTVTADSNGIVRFTLPHTYGAGEKMTLTVYYGSGQSFTQEIIVGKAVYLGTLEYGDVGSAVEKLTARLEALGYPVSETTRYGSTVREAVRLFQRANGLDDDGIAGRKTQEVLFSVSAIPYGTDEYPTLVRGDRDLDLIYTLQQRLKDLGYYTIRVDGIFGSGTQRAVRWFQTVNGLTATGRADNATQTLLYSSAAKPADSSVFDDYETLSRSSRYKSAVVPLQRRLRSLGYYGGNIDGYFGSQTYRAVRNFQSRNGLSVTGVADPYTQEVLYSSDAKRASSSSSSGYRLLYWGCRGDAVRRLQKALIDAGYKSIVRTADGIFGQWTYDAVRAYQRDHGLAVDGIAGKNTQNSLYGTHY